MGIHAGLRLRAQTWTDRVHNNIDKDNYIFVTIGRYMQSALIDTGSHYSCISLSLLFITIHQYHYRY